MIRSQNKIQIESGSSSMSDLVFLLLIFFMLTSTLISPNAVKLFLPESNNKTMAKESVTIYISDLGGTAEDGSTLSRCQFQIDETPLVASLGSDLVDEMKGVLVTELETLAPGDDEAGVFVRADQTVDVQYIVNVIDAVNQINKERNTKHKVVLGTKPSK
ncbi:MAG: biopolymer transporter ExbD [Bacteroidales bacterium]|nr:biopolymer transporter ExbD [Bacteroidales bacterium]MCR5192757.1 biopolymer transporter ExbD [Bacteroidales bacterium]